MSEEAFNRKAVRSLVRKSVRVDEATIEDLVSEIYTKCLEKSYKPTKKIIRNTCFDWLRHQKVVIDGAYTFAILHRSDETAFDPKYVHELLEKSNLTPNEQQLVWETFWLDLSPINKIAILANALRKLLITAKKGRK